MAAQYWRWKLTVSASLGEARGEGMQGRVSQRAWTCMQHSAIGESSRDCRCSTKLLHAAACLAWEAAQHMRGAHSRGRVGGSPRSRHQLCRQLQRPSWRGGEEALPKEGGRVGRNRLGRQGAGVGQPGALLLPGGLQ